MRRIRGGVALSVVALVVVGLAVPALAAATDPRPNGSVVVLTGRVEVHGDEVVDDVVVFDGAVSVAGRVRHSVVAFNGDVEVTGAVGDQVVALNGRVTVRGGGRVGGDVVSRLPARVLPGAVVGGRVRQVDVDALRIRWAGAARLALWLALSVSMLVLGVLLVVVVPRGVDRAAAALRDASGAVVGWGALLGAGLPVVAVLLLLTLVGIPLGVALLAALVPLYAAGYVIGAHAVGRLLVRGDGDRVAAFLVGLAIARAGALVPWVGGLIGAAVTVLGLGGTTVAVWRARDRARAAAAGAASDARAPQWRAGAATPI